MARAIKLAQIHRAAVMIPKLVNTKSVINRAKQLDTKMATPI
jgi:hypothetical protein